MAELLFKRGLHANLPKGASVKDGAFYLTTDSHRLYAGIGSELVDLNQYINVVNDLTEANALPNLKDGDFVYLKTGNILAICVDDGTGTKKFKQINTQAATVTNQSLAIAGDSTKNELTISVTDSNDNVVKDTIQIIGSAGTDVTMDSDGNITVSGVQYSLSGSLDSNHKNYQLSLSPDDNHAINSPSSSVTLQAGENITFTGENGNLTITSKNTTFNGATGTFTANKNGGATVSFTDEDGNVMSAANTGGFYYTYGKQGDQTAYNQNALSVYTIAEIDKIVKDLNAMVYKGPVSLANELPSVGVRTGDTYMASAGTIKLSDLGITTNNNVTYATIGDLFIATGTEDEDGFITSNTLKWTYIPSGDDSQTDTTYSIKVDIATNKLSISNESTGDVIGYVQMVGSEKITVASTSDAEGHLITTFTHAAPGAADDTKIGNAEVATLSPTAGNEVPVVSGVSVDSTGHIIAVERKSLKTPTYTLSGVTIESDTNVATITDTLTDSEGTAAGTSVFTLAAEAEDSLKLAVTENKISLSIEWGEF